MLVVEENNTRKMLTGLVPRWYQENLIRAIFKENKKRLLLVWSRRAGKDVIAWNCAIWFCLSQRAIVWYIFPNQPQARSAIWSGMTMDGRTFLSYIPEHTILKLNEARMEVHFKNGSILALKGSTNYDSLRGANPTFVVFSEYAYQDPSVFPLIISPILRANPNAVALFISTPAGANHFFELAEIAKNTPEEWHYDFLNVEQTGHVDVEKIKEDVRNGLISQDQVDQEYYCSFQKGVQGSVFGRQLNKLKLDDRLTFVPYEPSHPVYVSCDLGWDEDFAFVFFQVIGQAVRIIDTFADRQHDIPYYAEMLFDKKYNYGTLFLPHDAEVHSLNDGNTRTQIFEDLGFKCHGLKRKAIPDMIEDGRKIFARLWLDERKTTGLVKSLENYRREWDDNLQKYKDKPIHDQWSHYADAFMYMAAAVEFATPSMTQEDADKMRERAIAKHSPWAQYHQWGSR